MPQKRVLLQIDMKIMNLRERIRNGAANREIAQTELTELLNEREKKLKEITAANEPTKDLPPS